MLSEGVTNEMVKAGIDLQAHMSVSVMVIIPLIPIV